MPAELAGQFFFSQNGYDEALAKDPTSMLGNTTQLLNSLGMKSDAITMVVFSHIEREQQLDFREYGSYKSENSRIFRECLVGQISRKFLGRKVCRQLWRVRIEL